MAILPEIINLLNIIISLGERTERGGGEGQGGRQVHRGGRGHHHHHHHTYLHL